MRKNRPSVSVAMATYNGEKFIREQLESLADQTVLPDELVVSDDGSSDGTIAIIEEFALLSSFPVKLLKRDKRLGVRDNFFEAMRVCKGDCIALCDQDDIWTPHKVQVASAHLARPEISLLIHSAELISSYGEKIGIRFPSFSRTIEHRPLTIGPYFSAWGFSMVFKREIADIILAVYPAHANTDVSSRFFHDTWVQIFAPIFGNLLMIDQTLAYYRQHGSNVVGVPSETDRRGIKINPTMMRERLEGKYRYNQFIAECLSTLVVEGRPEWKDRAIKALRYYSHSSERFSRRVGLYKRQDNFLRRNLLFFDLLTSGDYRSISRGGFGLKGFLRDALFALPFKIGQARSFSR